MTLEEAKDIIAQRNGKENWKMWSYECSEPYGRDIPSKFLEEAFKLYMESLYCFESIDVFEEVPEVAFVDEVVIAFVPLKGFQSCRYFNGSKTWQSMITGETVLPTKWFKRIK